MSTEVKPGYKLTEVGVIPDDWDISSLKDACIKITDGTHDTPKPVKAGIPFLTAIHVKDNRIYHEDCLYITKEEHEIIFKRCNPALNDVLMVNIGAGVATTALVDVSHEFSLKNVALLKPEAKRLTGLYLNYSLAYKKTEITEALLSGGAQPFLSLSQICQIKIPIPGKEDQRTISAALSDMDALISGLNKLISKKRDIKQAAMQKLLSGRQRLPGFSMEWEVKRFFEVFSRVNGKNHQVQTANYKIYGAYPIVDQGKEFVVGYSDENDKVYSCPSGGVIVFGDHTCIIKYIDFDFIVGADGTQIIRAKDGECARFLAYALEFSGITSTGYNRHFKLLKELEFLMPALEEQVAIASILSDMDSELTALETRRDKSRELKQGMMQELLTGRIRLSQSSQEAELC